MDLVMNLGIISSAFADGAAAAQPSAMPTLLMLGAFVFIFYFLMLRPQQKRAKEHKNLLANLQTGDEVMLAGGIIGKVGKIKDEFCVVSVNDSTEIKVQKASIASVLPKGTMNGIDNS